MNLDAWIALLTTAAVFAGLQLRRSAPTDLLFLLAVVIVTVTDVITPEMAFRGLANEGVITIAGLLVVGAGLRSTGVLDWVSRGILGNASNERTALLRLAPALLAASAFVLNTALVAMMAPVLVDWCRRRQISPSRMLMPLSYLVILGGVCTLVGTSTTLVANALLRSYENDFLARTADAVPAERARHLAFAEHLQPLGLFEIGMVGLPCAIVGTTFVLLVGRRLLPNRTDMLEQLGEQRREYLVELMVQSDCPLIAKTVEQAGLRHLPGLFLIEIDRDGDVITPVGPHELIHEGDRLVFTGVVSTIVDLERIPGLVPAADMTYQFHPRRKQGRRLTEVVLSRTSPLIGHTVRQANFRRLYHAAVVAVHRNGVRLTNKVGSIRLEPGDTLLLQTRDDFVSTYRNSRDFYLVSSIEGWQPTRHHRSATAAALSLLLVAWLVIGNWPSLVMPIAAFSSPALAAVAIACLMVVTGCMTVSDARSALDWRILLTIAGALGLGAALTESGAAAMVANTLVETVGDRPLVLLVVVYFLTLLLTEMISNNAVPAVLLPIAIGVAWEGGYSPRPFIMAITLVASLSFMTPVGYQTNLMVMGPGGYRPIDYLRCGTPLAVAVAITALVLLPQVWPF